MALVHRGAAIVYQRSIRRNGRVTTRYVASGERAILFAWLDAQDRAERAEQAALERAERDRLDDIDRGLEQHASEARDAAHAVLTAAGFHQHHGSEWRRKTWRTHPRRATSPV